ncbi:MAG: MauE/DoxX family redox-associated membrane protein [Bacteroidota bacterium]
MKHILPLLLAVLMLFSAYNHLANPDFYSAMIPSFIPEAFANVLSTILEAAIGIALIIPKYRQWGGLGFFLLMIAFLPLHIWDLLKESPMVGSKNAAIIRLVIQFVLIYLGWRIWKRYELENNS